MAKYRVYMQRIITEWAEVEVEAVHDREAEDIAWGMACDGDVDFDPDFEPELAITEVELIEADAD